MPMTNHYPEGNQPRSLSIGYWNLFGDGCLPAVGREFGYSLMLEGVGNPLSFIQRSR
jgi:hypothetical protein